MAEESFTQYYRITVSFDTEYGNNDDKHYIAKDSDTERETFKVQR